MLVGREPQLPIILGKIWIRVWRIMRVMWDKQLLWEDILLMLLGYRICTGMFGNGVMMVGMIIIKMLQSMEVVGMRMILKVVQEYCAVVLGTSVRGTVARRIGSGTMRTTGAATTASVFGLLFALSRISFPLPFYSFTLCKPNAAVRWIDFFSRRDITLLCPKTNVFQDGLKGHNGIMSLQ